MSLLVINLQGVAKRGVGEDVQVSFLVELRLRRRVLRICIHELQDHLFWLLIGGHISLRGHMMDVVQVLIR